MIRHVQIQHQTTVQLAVSALHVGHASPTLAEATVGEIATTCPKFTHGTLNHLCLKYCKIFWEMRSGERYMPSMAKLAS